MKLHEEFREYDNLWEDYEPDEVDNILWATDDFEFEYDGWTEEGYEDRFDPGSWHGHYQVSKTYEYDDFTYTVDAVEMFELLRDKFLPKMADKISNAELAAEYKKLDDAFQNSTDETEDAAGEALDLFIAKNLETFVEMFYEELQAHYEEAAYDWARNNW